MDQPPTPDQPPGPAPLPLLKLRGEDEVTFRLQALDHRSISAPVTIRYEIPGTTRLTEYAARVAELTVAARRATTEDEARATTIALIEYKLDAAAALVRGVDGLDGVEPDDDAGKLLREYQPDFLDALASHVFERRARITVAQRADLGKSERTRAPS